MEQRVMLLLLTRMHNKLHHQDSIESHLLSVYNAQLYVSCSTSLTCTATQMHDSPQWFSSQ